MQAIWKPIPIFNGSYLINGIGEVKSVTRIVKYSNGRKRIHYGQCIKQSMHRGYKVISVYRKQYSIHRLVAKTFLSIHEFNGAVVNHKDGNKLNNSVSNLEWCTQKYNDDHATKNKLKHHAKGEKNGCAKLSETEVLSIRMLVNKGDRQSEIADRLSISRATVCNIIKRKTWAHI